MEPDRLRPGRLPQHVVLQDPDSAIPHERSGETTDALGEHLCGDDRVGLPGVAELPRPVLGIASRNPVDLVRADPGLVLTVEETPVAVSQRLERAFRNEPFLDDQEAVAPESVDLLRCESVDQERGRVFSGS